MYNGLWLYVDYSSLQADSQPKSGG